jgi:hypothetical protein
MRARRYATAGWGMNSCMPRLARLAAACAALALFAPAAEAHAANPGPGQQQLHRYARDTWASFVAMTDPRSGLPTDALAADGTRDVQTSTTNIGAYMWSAVVAQRLGIIDRRELVARLSRTIGTLEHMERHRPDGQFYNWYDHRDGSKLTVNQDGTPRTPILSSVDNGWLAVGLRVVQRSVPQLSARAGEIYDSMDFGFYYRPDVNRILFHYAPDTGDAPCCYDTIVSESRIASYVGIAKGELPRRQYYGPVRTFPDTCAGSFQETKPVGFQRSLFGEPVFEGAYAYNGTRVTPSWGGSMFEALMPTLFVPEERWAPGSWGPNHPLTVAAQIHHGLEQAGYGYWGFSPANVPEGGYDVYGVDAIGMWADGNPSNEDKTLVDGGFRGCPDRSAKEDPPQAAYTNGVVTPHAAFLALRWAPKQALANLGKLERDFHVYDHWGFRDSVNVGRGAGAGVVSNFYLSLDQGMIMGAIGNALDDDVLRRAFVSPGYERTLRPVMGVEEFNDDPRGCTIDGTSGDDRLTGTARDDVICAGAGRDRIDGRGGDDAIFGDAGDDRVEGGAGQDTLYGDDGADQLSGGRGVDVLSGGPGDDRCSDPAGADTRNDCR